MKDLLEYIENRIGEIILDQENDYSEENSARISELKSIRIFINKDVEDEETEDW